MLKELIRIIAFFLPSWINRYLYQLIGYSLSKKAKISIFSYVKSDIFVAQEGVWLRPLTIIRSKRCILLKHAVINSLTLVNSRNILIGPFAKLSSLVIVHGGDNYSSYFSLGQHSRIFPFAWLDTTRGIKIGKQVGVGGYALLFTHGMWANYLKGGPISYGPINIEDEVWLPWRVFVLPNVTIGSRAIVSANSTVVKSIPDNCLASGTPARIISKTAHAELTSEVLKERISLICKEYRRKYPTSGNEILLKIATEIEVNSLEIAVVFSEDCLKVIHSKEIDLNKLKYLDLNSMTAHNIPDSNEYTQFLTFLNRYGVRLVSV